MAKNRLTVVMYHYVRDLKNSRFPLIKGLDVGLFKEQLDYLEKYYHVVSMEDVMAFVYDGIDLPDKPVLLTFDDGYADHFTNVFPILYNRGIQGSFFAPVKAITEHIVLDVNKIHFILAAIKDIRELLETVRKLLDEYREVYKLESFEYYNKLAYASRFDPADVIFIKRLLQVELEENARRKVTDKLFRQVIGLDEDVFSRELYMNEEQIHCMVKCGMHIGVHGYDHYWLGALSRERQEIEIQKSLDFIQRMNVKDWSICYPYGSYNRDTLELVKRYGCKLGLTTEVGIAILDKSDRDSVYCLPRLDTNDLPKDAGAPVNKWYDIL